MLNLAIARRIIELHGGRMWVESMPARVHLWFTVPIRVEPPVAPMRSASI